MKKSIKAPFIALFFLLMIYFKSHELKNLDIRERYGMFLNSHPFNNRERESFNSENEEEEEEEADRPNLAWEQDYLRTMDPALGRPTPERLLPILKQMSNFSLSKNGPGSNTTPWVERGPNNVGGRTRAIAFDPNDVTGNKVWAGGVTGGLWYTNNITLANVPWVSVNDFWNNIAITAIAFDPTNTQVMYVATGEGWQAGAGRGAGIWKSTNGGSTWNQLSSTTSYYYINDLVVRNESGTGVVYAAVDGNYYNGVWHGTSSAGLQRSTNGGTTWTQVMPVVPSNSINFVVADIEIGANNRIWVGSKSSPFSATDRGGGRVLYSDNGTTWTISNTTTVTNGNGRVEVACAPSNASYVYALIEDNGTTSAIKSTTNGGTSWNTMTIPADADNGIPSTDFSRGQAWYDLIMAVDPNNENVILAGGVDLFRSANGGSTWSQISKWSNNNNLAALPCSYVHADQHALVFKPGSSNILLSGNDGGIFYTSNASIASTANVFIERNLNYNVTQFYACAIHPSASVNHYLAGAQDNGTVRVNGSGMSPGVDVSGGDGAYCFIDQTSPTHQITSYVYNTYYLSTNGGSSFNTTLVSDQNTGKFINPADYDDNMHVLYSSRSTSSIARIRNITTTPSSQETVTISGMTTQASHIRVSPYTTTSTTLFLGTENGNIFKVTNANATSSVTNITGTGLPTGSISCIEIGANEDELLVTFFNYGITSVWYTNNGGGSWVSKEGNLPDMPVRWALFNPNNRNEVLLATELGVWSTTNLNATTPTWATSNNGLANVRVDMLQIRNSDLQVLAATYGRGIFTSNGFTASLSPSAGFYGSNLYPCLGETVTLKDTSLFYPTGWNWTITPNTFTFVNSTSSTSQNPQIQFNASGTFSITLTASNVSGQDQSIKTNYIVAGGYSLPFSEDWETTANVNRWTIDNQDLDATWSIATVGGNTPGTKAMKMSNFNYSLASNTITRDGLISPVIRLGGYGSATLSFKYAYKRLNTSAQDSLAIFISTNCGNTWTRVASYKETNSASPFVFITANNSTSTFTPSVAADWCGVTNFGACKTVNLDAYAGQDIKIKFESISGNGNNLYLDNINVTGILAGNKPTVQFNAGNTTPCSGSTVSFRDTTTNTPTSWEWTFTPNTVSFVNGTSSTSQHPFVVFNNVGAYSVKLKATNSSGTDSVTKSSYINVTSTVTPTVNINSGDTGTCVGTALLLTSTITNGGSNPTYIWMRNTTNLGVNNDSLLLSSFSTGDTITCKITSNATCANPQTVTSNSVKLTSYSKPVVSYILPTDNICNNDTILNLGNGIPAGGVFSGTGVSGNQFKTSISGPGTYLIYYAYTDVNGCKNTAMDTLSVNSLPTSNLILTKNNLCYKDTIVLSGGSPIGGIYSGQGVSGNVFRTSSLNTGKYGITYTVTSIKGCQAKSTDSITVKALPAVTLTLTKREICINDSMQLSGQSPTGGVFNGNGVTGSNFKPITGGKSIIQYIYTDLNGCSNTAKDSVNVNTLPTVSVTLPYKKFCLKDTTFSLSGGIPTGGVYSGNGINGGSFSSIGNPAGNYPILYSFTDTKGCINSAKDTIQIYALPTVTFILPNKVLCESDTILQLSGGNPTGGIYSGGGVISGTFNPAQNGAGNYAIKYSYTNNNGCSSAKSDTLTVLVKPNKPSITKSGNTLTCSETSSNYEWYLNDVKINGATSKTYQAITSGIYKVKIINVNNCFSISDPLSVNTGIKNTELQSDWKVYPNPSTGKFELSSAIEFPENCKIEIYDLSGRVVYMKQLSSNTITKKIEIDTELESGSYILSVIQENGRKDITILIQK